MMRVTEEAMLKAGTPMFIIRVSVSAAELVCRVEHQVAGLSGLDGDLGGFQIPDLPTMTMSGSWRRKERRGAGEGEPRLGIDLHLVDAGQVDLHRIFGGGDVDLAGVENVETGMRATPSCPTRGAGDQYHPCGLERHAGIAPSGGRRKPVDRY